MTLFQPINVFEESWFLLSIIKILGLFPFRRSCGRIKYLYTLLFLIIYYLLFYVLNDYTLTLFKNYDVWTTAIILRKIRYHINAIILPVLVLLSINFSSKAEALYTDVDDADKSLKFLNARLDYKRHMKLNIAYTSGMIFAVMMFNVIDYYSMWDHSVNYMFTFMWIIDRLPDLIGTMIISSFVGLLIAVRLRFEAIDRIVSDMTKEKSSIGIELPSGANDVRRMKLLKRYYEKLCMTVTCANAVYGLQLIITFISYFIYICLNLNIVYSKINIRTDLVDVLISLFWIIIDLGRAAYVMRIYQITMYQMAVKKKLRVQSNVFLTENNTQKYKI